MLFSLKFVPAHPVYRLHEAIGFFISIGLNEPRFSRDRCLPAWFTPVFDDMPAMRRHLRVIFRETKHGGTIVRRRLQMAWTSNNRIESLCNNTAQKIQRLGGCSPALQRHLKTLFEYLYESALEAAIFVRASGNQTFLDHYRSFRKINDAVCPFCGLENYVDRSDKLRSTYDHYLPRHKYPLAAVNFTNLVPMCERCNQRPNKGAIDPLKLQSGKRRPCYYPYRPINGLKLAVSCRRRPSLDDGGLWRVKIAAMRTAESPKITTWKAIFRFPERYQTRLEERNLMWARYALAHATAADLRSVATLRRLFRKEAKILRDPIFVRTKNEALLQSAYFKYLSEEADAASLQGLIAAARSVPRIALSNLS